MNSPSSINRPVQPFYGAGSGLRSPLDKDDLTNQHKKNKVDNASTFGLKNTVATLVSAELRKRRRVITPPNQIASSQVKTFQIVSDGGDWYNCYTFDGLTAGTTIIKVAKHQDLRCILPSASPAGGAWVSKFIRGVTYTYGYTPTMGATLDGINVVEYVRSVSGDDTSSATEYVTPCLNCLNASSDPVGAGDIIEAFSTSFAAPDSLVGVTWQALADGRAWAGPSTP